MHQHLSHKAHPGIVVSQEPPVSFKDLFIAPTFDELEQVARNGAKSGAKKLNERQLESVRLMG